jgi:hypothetical protein
LEVKLHITVFSLLSDHFIMIIFNGAIVVFPCGSGLVYNLVHDFTNEMPMVDNFPCSVGRGVVFDFTCG